MTQIAAAHTDQTGAANAARDMADQINAALDGPPDALVVFASSSFDYTALLHELDARCRPRVMVGSSSAGEFTHDRRGVGTASALAFRSPHLHVRATIGEGIAHDSRGAARALVAGFQGLDGSRHPYRAALVMTDALAGRAEEFIDEVTLLTSGRYLLAGGGAGDDAKFSKTHVFRGTEVFTDAAVALEILSDKPIGVGVGHGWQPTGAPLRATEVDGMRVLGFNGLPAVEAFERHAHDTGQAFDRADPLPFFLHNILGIDTGNGYRLRVPLAIDDDGAVHCAAEVPEHARVHIMTTTSESAAEAAARATRAAVSALGDSTPGGAVFFDCVATRLRLGDGFGMELEEVASALDGAPFVGCNTYGQIARSDRQFSGFHNCTAVVLALPR
ncbi:MAG: FIST domain protein [Lysobacter sp.]|nr:MAG: FIST domain protein [Lysobacter sp.]